ncbi:MAG TPA: tetratricopeptide repeat protein, partial [Bacteroidales bacterium]|nr:tetratricopeptide repeat protein [Bacteroidales bacterium]
MRRISICVFLILLIFSNLCSAQSNTANELIDQSRYSEAASILENAIENGHADPSEMINLVYCYIKMHDYQKAEQTYVKIPAETKLDHIQYFYYGEVLRFNGKY